MGKERPLASLLEDRDAAITGDANVAVRGVAYDSRSVRPGDVFVAVPGFSQDGARFVPAALSAGAVAVVSELPAPPDFERVWVRVDSSRATLAGLACAWFEHPSHRLVTLGVTGTNGKTSVSSLLHALVTTRGDAGVWSTTSVRFGEIQRDAERTTPESLDLQRTLAEMLAAGCRTAILEVSSHALALDRVAGTRFHGAAFTNLTPDHLDFHRDMDDYFDAKARLFESLAPDAPGVINLSDPRGARMADRCSGHPVGYGWAEQEAAPYRIVSYSPLADGTRLTIESPQGALTMTSPLRGRANAENVAAAVALALETGVVPEAAIRVVEAFRGEPGRLEPVQAGQPFHVFVDFAHTPGALAAALEAGRSVADIDGGRVVVVFGCGGNRDRTKRPLMGGVAADLADVTVVTSDNPRNEEPEAIIEEILAGVPAARRGSVQVIADRAAAIDFAMNTARPGDCVILAGKGHERDQTFADRVVPFDDRQVARAALERMAGVAGETR